VSETKIREAPIAPRFELEDAPAPRLEPVSLATGEPRAAPLALGTGTLIASGISVLVLGLAALEVGNFVAAQFARAAVLGWLTLAVAVGGFGLIGAALWREVRGLIGLARVDHLRAALSDPRQAQAAALAWLDRLPEGAALRPAVAAADTPEAIAALLRAGPVASLRAQSDALGRQAALQVFAMTATLPAPSLDGLLMAWRGTRLVRQVAALHGLRPGLLGTLALLRRVAFSAASVVGADMVANAAAHAVLSHPLAQHVAGGLAGAGVAARRMMVLARVTAAACSPLGED
jgi:putative membrane protein